MSGVNPVVGWGTTADGKREPIRKDAVAAIWASIEAAKAKRETDMPTERDAILALSAAYTRLEDFGWKNPIYAPKDGSPLDIIEAGITGIHQGAYVGQWPSGSWRIYDGDEWPSRPTLARATPESPQP